MFKLKFIFRYLKYLIISKGANSIHSPFVFNLYYKVIKGNIPRKKFRNVELLRRELLHNHKTIKIEDFGAGSHTNNKSNIRKIKQIVAASSMKPKFCRMLASIARHFKTEVILELGTSAGFSTMYLANQCPYAKIYTIEGSEEIYTLACENFNKLNYNNIYAINDIFENALEKTLKKINKVDFVLFDGNHKKEPTLNYFDKCLQYVDDSSVFIFDDINWSDEMLDAWKIIQEHPRVSVSIDLFFCGIVFFKSGIVKQHFCLRF